LGGPRRSIVRRMRGPRHRFAAPALVAGLLAGAVAGCGDDGRTLRPPGATIASPTTTTSTTTTSTTTTSTTTTSTTTSPTTTVAPAAPVVARVCTDAASVSVAGPLPALFPEVSGLAASRSSPGTYWAIQDSGNPAELIAFDPVDESFRRVEIEGVSNLDFEDLAIGPDAMVWVADIGDNFTIRRRVTLHHFPEPAPQLEVVEPQTIDATYEDGPRDAEALFVTTGGVWLIEKTASGPSGVYRLDATVFRRVGEIDVQPALVTGADVAADGAIAVRTNRTVLVYAPVAGAAGAPDVLATLQAEPCVAPAPPEAQGESIAFTAGADAIVTVSEMGGDAPVDVHRIG
jgi:hypothetical protein